MRLLTILFLAALLAGCGGTSGSDRPEQPLKLLLDFTPNAVHAGLYLARARGYDEAEGVDLTLRTPGSSTDAVKLLASGRVDAAVLDIHDLGLARERGADIVGVLALVQRPLAAVLARPGIDSPADLEGRRAGVTGLPSDDAVLDSVVRGAGGDPAKVRKTTIGFEAVPALIAGRVAAATAFWNVEGVALKAAKPGSKEFRVDQFGAPAYPELVVCVQRRTLDEDRDTLRAFARAVRRGYEETQRDPDSAVGTLRDKAGAAAGRRADLLAQLDAVAPAFTAGVPAYGMLDRRRLEAWADWDVEFGILKRKPDVDRAFDFSVAK